ncbi:hypothetical protein [Sphingomonas psychrotolerans]|uniref:Uncharacterized protein n=1 Tax=Sphingomonas psychrotolerans TaxID=1327635 RepID=A0A2K8M9R6_9SPHN|nr:hypothetical protein [Sphingomonas psychrotolerans]ATY30607.1 hypothetical protein CVN68_00185 [Sphingomonas psychrotolerans]
MRGLAKFRLPFTEAEEALVARIDFGQGHNTHTDRHAAFLSNKEPILALLESLSERGAVPDQRLRYWNDPEYQPGRLKGSRKQLFERHNDNAEEIYTHPHFIPYLRYILFGADLPTQVMTEFEAEVGNPEWVSYGDALELGSFARSLVRRHGLQPHEACEEFFKLSLDLGLSVDESLRIRRTVMETR